MLATHVDAESRYNAIRKAALAAVSRQVPTGSGLDFELIN